MAGEPSGWDRYRSDRQQHERGQIKAARSQAGNRQEIFINHKEKIWPLRDSARRKEVRAPTVCLGWGLRASGLPLAWFLHPASLEWLRLCWPRELGVTHNTESHSQGRKPFPRASVSKSYICPVLRIPMEGKAIICSCHSMPIISIFSFCLFLLMPFPSSSMLMDREIAKMVCILLQPSTTQRIQKVQLPSANFHLDRNLSVYLT